MATYGERIRELRKNRHMSQQDLANLLDVSKVAVSQYEREVRKPDINVVTALCDIFNVSSDYLLGTDDVTIRFVGDDDIRKLDADGYYVYGETAEIAQEIFENPDSRALFDASRGSRPEDLRMAADLLNRLKRTNPDG